MAASNLLSTSIPSVDLFRSSLEGDFALPGEAGYQDGITRWTPLVEQPAAYVVFPKTNADVAKAIQFARVLDVEIAVCGGGHSWSGASSTKGLVIHLGRYMNSVRVDPEAKLFYVGGGAIWKTVDAEGMKHGLATVAGGVEHTGVGGLALGGGFGWLTGRHGLVVDNTVQYTVVLASGEIVTANAEEHPDLYWALRGGGSNFGVVTEFVFKAHSQSPTVYFTQVAFPPSRASEVIDALEDWFETVQDDEMAVCGYARPPPHFEPLIFIMYFYNGEPEQARLAFKKILDLGPIIELPVERLPYEQLNAQQNAQGAPGHRVYSKGLSVPKVTHEMVKTLFDAVDATVAKEPKLGGSISAFEFIPRKTIGSVPVPATAYPNRGNSREILLAIIQDDPELDAQQKEAVRGWHRQLQAVLKDGSATGYANYEGDAVNKGAEGQFGENYARLRQVKAKYDPNQVFNKWFPITPAA